MRIRSVMVSATLLLSLASCVETVDCDVMRLHKLAPPSGETIAVRATKPETERSLEFAGYRELIVRELAATGYRPVDWAGAQLEAHVDYSIERAPDRRSFYWPSCSYHYHFLSGQTVWPAWHSYECWDAPLAESVPQYLRELRIDIVPGNDPAGDHLFEGRVRSLGTSARLNEVMPYLVTAMFKNFPGESGKWKTVSITKDEALPAIQPTAARPVGGGESCIAHNP
jgi:hypothetical protein